MAEEADLPSKSKDALTYIWSLTSMIKWVTRIFKRPDRQPMTIMAEATTAIQPEPCGVQAVQELTQTQMLEVLTRDLPGLPATIERVRWDLTFRGMSLTGSGQDGQLWSERIELSFSDDSTIITAIAPRVFVSRTGKHIGPRLLRNWLSLADQVGATLIRAHVSMNMGRALTCAGFLPISKIWPTTRENLVKFLELNLPSYPDKDEIIEEIRVSTRIAIRNLVPDYCNLKTSHINLSELYPEICHMLFRELSWEAEFDTTDDDARQRLKAFIKTNDPIAE